MHFNSSIFQNHTEDTLRQELVTLQEEKLNYESTAKVFSYFSVAQMLQKLQIIDLLQSASQNMHGPMNSQTKKIFFFVTFVSFVKFKFTQTDLKGRVISILLQGHYGALMIKMTYIRQIKVL